MGAGQHDAVAWVIQVYAVHRAGQGDVQLKALRGLYKQYHGVDEKKTTLINAQIEVRLAAIQAERAKKIEVDLSSLPTDLIEELGLTA